MSSLERHIEEPVEADLLHDIAAGIAQAVTLWRPLVVHDQEERRPVRLLATDRYEVWVIGWMPGQRAALHDHGAAAGALAVVEGELTEDALTSGGLRRDRLGAGELLDLPAGIVHEVSNTSDAPATSIHVYSPPLRTMTRYDDENYEPTITEIVAHEPPRFEVSASSLTRHPSVGHG
jgi:predicted metal-dependent enzyme (double-stranded beta helix superfamily)